MKIVNKDEFDTIIKNGNVIVDFYADWCGPCKMLGPVLEKISAKYPDITFIKVNVDKEEQLAASFKIMSIPAVFMLKDGNIVNKFVGLLPEAEIINIINNTY